MPQNVIKWTGSKRVLARDILVHFPCRIGVYFEPFIGGGAMLRAVLDSNIKVGGYVASDLCKPLIVLWSEIQKRPKKLWKQYRDYWLLLKERGVEAYYDVRREFNKDQSNVGAFLFLLRTCANGIVRFNSKGGFNTSIHHNRSGILPDTLKMIIWDWHLAIQPVSFVWMDYKEAMSMSEGEKDFFFLDPPYENSSSLYLGSFDHEEFFRVLSKTKRRYALTLNGVRDKGASMKNTIPASLYRRYVPLCGMQSSMLKVKTGSAVNVSENLYLNY